MNRTRRTVVAGVLAGVAGAMLVVLPAPAAYAHGGLTYPATRTYACYVDGLQGGQGGDLNPTNAACRAAWQTGDRYAFWNWFGNLISDNAGRHRERIPDGQLCGPTAPFSSFNAARTDWPVTDVQANATVTLRYNAWAPHPGTWYQYVTRDGFNPAQPLRWSDLEATPFNQVTNPPLNGSGPHGAEYTWQAQLPNKTGRHIIYSVWQRSDSPEAFFNCSDVNFGGGGPTDPPPPPPPPPPPTSCAVNYTTPSQWNNGFTADVRVTNTGTNPVHGWTVRWTFPSGQRVTGHWNSTIVQTGADATASNAAWNSSIPPGSSVTFGFQGSHTGTNTPPTSFTACQASAASSVASGLFDRVLASMRAFLSHDALHAGRTPDYDAQHDRDVHGAHQQHHG